MKNSHGIAIIGLSVTLLLISHTTLAEEIASDGGAEDVAVLLNMIRWSGVAASVFVVAGSWLFLRILNNVVLHLGEIFAERRLLLENFMGTLNLFADRPVRVGDFCRYGKDISPSSPSIGTVEEIGLRSTSIRGLDRSITTIPNAAFSNMHIINLTKRDRMLYRSTISLRYETTPEQMRLVLAQLRELLLEHPRIAKEPVRVRAIGFGEFSLDLEIFAYVMTSDWSEFLAVQEDLVLRIMDVVAKAGTAFAIPSRTVYHTRDAGIDIEQQQTAEKQLRELAAAHEE